METDTKEEPWMDKESWNINRKWQRAIELGIDLKEFIRNDNVDEQGMTYILDLSQIPKSMTLEEVLEYINNGQIED